MNATECRLRAHLRGPEPAPTVHDIRWPADPATVACSCGWVADVPLGHSKTDAHLDHILSTEPKEQR